MKRFIYTIAITVVGMQAYAQQAELSLFQPMKQEKEIAVRPVTPVHPFLAQQQSNATAAKTTGTASRLVAITNFGNANNQYELQDSSRYFFSGDRGGDLNSDWIYADSYIGWQYEPQLQQYRNYNTSAYTYDAQGRPVEDVYKMWDVNTQSWKNYNRRTWTYNTQGEIATETSEEWDQVNNVWKGAFFTMYTYDGLNQLIEEKQQKWINNSWQNYHLYSYTYNGTEMTSRSTQSWTNNAWKNLYKYTLTYAGGKVITETYQTWDNVNNGWKNQLKSLYSYNSSGTLSDKETKVWNNNVWNNDDWTTFTYTATDKLETQLAKDWLNNAWQNLYKFDYTYNAQDKVKERIGTAWTNNAWENSSKYIYSYDANGNLISETQALPYLNSLWKFHARSLYSYNSFDQQTMRATETYNGSQLAWLIGANDSKTIYYYEEHATTGTPNLKQLAAELTVYPNPATDHVNVSIKMEKPEGAQLVICDMYGRIVVMANYPAMTQWNDQLDVSKLASGMYQCIVRTASGQKTEKINIF